MVVASRSARSCRVNMFGFREGDAVEWLLAVGIGVVGGFVIVRVMDWLEG